MQLVWERLYRRLAGFTLPRTGVIWLRMGTSIALLAWLLWLVDTEQLLSALSGISAVHLLMLLLVIHADRILMAYKWTLLLKVKGIHLSQTQAIRTYYKATLLGTLALPTIATDAVRVYDIYGETKRLGDVLTSVAMERAIGLVASSIVCIASMVLFVLTLGVPDLPVLILVISVALTFCTLVVLSLNPRLLDLLQSIIGRSKWRITGKATSLINSYRSYASFKAVLTSFLVLSLLEQFFPVLSSYIVSQALGLDIDLLLFVLFVPITSVAMRLPISYEGYGIREGMFVYLFGLAGVPPSESLLAGLMTGILWQLAFAPVAIGLWLVGGARSRANVTPRPSTLQAEKRSVQS